MNKADELMREVAHIIKQLDPPQRSKWEHYQLTHAKDGLLLIESITGSKYEVSYNGDIADQIISREQDAEDRILPLKENATLYDAIVLLYDHDRQDEQHPDHDPIAYQTHQSVGEALEQSVREGAEEWKQKQKIQTQDRI